MSNKVLTYFNGDVIASDVWQSKYQVKDNKGCAIEKTPTDMHKRLATQFARIEYGYKDTKRLNNSKELDNLSYFGRQLLEKRMHQTREEITTEIFGYFDKFRQIIPQGSVMFNLGNEYVFGSLSNCFGIASPYDSYAGIMRTDEELAHLMKRRGGVGMDLSTLRPGSSPVSNAAKTSTGVISFAERYSNTTREVAQEGRRGALMELLHVKHPEIFKFVTMKSDRTKVTGANITTMLTDEFMGAVEENRDFICTFPIGISLLATPEDMRREPYNQLIPLEYGSFMKIRARELFNLIAEMAHKNGEPGIAYIDRIRDYSPDGVYKQYFPSVCNPCVTGDTEILTEHGYIRIDTLIDREVKVWNGFEWSIVRPKITGTNQHVCKVNLSDGRSLTCTDYHRWILKDGTRVKTNELTIGDKLLKYEFPIIIDGEEVSTEIAYTQGFISADGQDNYNHLWLYETKFMCREYLDGKSTSGFTTNTGIEKELFHLNKKVKFKEKSFIPFKWSVQAKLDWLSGLFDGDATELVDGGVQLGSINLEFLIGVQKLLSLLTVNCKVVNAQDEGMKSLPNGKGGHKDYFCQKSWRICIGAKEIQRLDRLGLFCHRLVLDRTPNRSAQRFVYIKSIEDVGVANIVYCFDEPKRHYGIFNGILTGQCSEQWFAPYETCRLIAENFFSFVDEPFQLNSSINLERVYEISYMQQVLGDDLVDLELEHIDRILEKIKSDPEPEEIKRVELELWQKVRKIAEDGRRTGNGFTGLGDMLAALGLRYGSDTAYHIIEAVTKTKMKAELDATIDMAITRGAFKGWNPELEYMYGDGDNMIGFIGNSFHGHNSFYEMLAYEFPEQAHRMCEFGRRNISWSTVAPTGTVSIMTQTTGGLEPLFKAFHIRRKKINPSDRGARTDFTDQNGDNWQEYVILHPKFKDWIQLNSRKLIAIEGKVNFDLLDKGMIEALFEQSPWYGSEASDIDYKQRIRLQAVIQKYTSNAISSTINLAKDVERDTVKDIYLKAWKAGLKGITVYREGSRTGVLISEAEGKVDSIFGYNNATKRPKVLDAQYHYITTNNRKYAIVVGLLNGNPYELFAFENPMVESPLEGSITKIAKNEYKFSSLNFEITHLELSSSLTDEKLLTRWVSLALRHGANPRYIIEQVDKSEMIIHSFAKSISRVLRRYVKDEVLVGEACSNCGETTIRYEEGCKKCTSCGFSRC